MERNVVSSGRSPRTQTLWTSALLVLVLAFSFVAYVPSLSNGFTNWDDGEYITENRSIRDLSADNFRAMFTSVVGGTYSPVVMTSFALEYHFFKLAPFGYHFDNCALHVANCALVFWLILLISGRASVSLIATLLFGIHPIHVESVAWVTERKDMLFSLFFLAALISYIYYKKNGKLVLYGLSLASILVSHLAKPQAVMFFAVLLVFDYFCFHRVSVRVLVEKVPFLLLSLGFVVSRSLDPEQSASLRLTDPAFVVKSLLDASYALLFYVQKLALPVRLSAAYAHPDNVGGVTHALYCVSPVIDAAIGAAAYFSMRRTWKVAFAALFFVVNLVVVLFIGNLGAVIVADRYAYVPSIGFSYLFAEGVVWLFGNTALPAIARFALAPVLAVGVGAFSLQTWNRCAVWNDSKTLWSDAVERSPGSAIAHNNLGRALGDEGRRDEAIAQYQQALRLDPSLAKAHCNLGALLTEQGKDEEAMQHFSEALRIAPGYAKVHANLGLVLARLGRLDEAVGRYEEALRINPALIDVHTNLGLALEKQRKYGQAIAHHQAVLRLDPSSAVTCNYIGIALAKQGKLDEAIQYFEAALRIEPDFAAPRNNITIAQRRKSSREAGP